MAPKFVAPYRPSGKRGKNAATDVQAICEAVARPQMRFVPVKSVEQQGQWMVHRPRAGFVQQRTATLNRIRGLLSELGIGRAPWLLACSDRHCRQERPHELGCTASRGALQASRLRHHTHHPSPRHGPR